jgi:hypothetical protein
MNLVSLSFNLKVEADCFSEALQNIYQTPQDLNILVPEVSQGAECGRRCSKSIPCEYVKRANQYTASLGNVTLFVLRKRRCEVSCDNINAVLFASLQANCIPRRHEDGTRPMASSPAPVPALGSTQPHIRWILRSLSSGMKRPERDAEHSSVYCRSQEWWSSWHSKAIPVTARGGL